MNRVIITGNLTRDIELPTIPSSGTLVANFSVVVNDNVKKNDEWAEETSFFDVTAFGSTADALANYTSKGSPILIEGRLKQQTWETDGQARSKVNIIAERVEFIGKNKTVDTDAITKIGSWQRQDNALQPTPLIPDEQCHGLGDSLLTKEP